MKNRAGLIVNAYLTPADDHREQTNVAFTMDPAAQAFKL
jgi:hypothetical protein